MNSKTRSGSNLLNYEDGTGRKTDILVRGSEHPGDVNHHLDSRFAAGRKLFPSRWVGGIGSGLPGLGFCRGVDLARTLEGDGEVDDGGASNPSGGKRPGTSTIGGNGAWSGARGGAAKAA